MRSRSRQLFLAIGLASVATAAHAQTLGTYAWQLQPYCNVVTLTVTQNGSVYTLDGWDDQCGAAQKAPLVGGATLNPDGSIGFGLHITTVPGGVPVSLDARISVASLSGPWSDSAGNAGTLAFAASSGGSPRPAGSGVNPALVQSRISGTCAAGQAMRGIAQDGSVTCETLGAGGDITSVSAGVGLTGGGASGAVSLGVNFGGSGSAAQAARADHTHASAASIGSTQIGFDAMPGNTQTNNTAAGYRALFGNINGQNNTGIGALALWHAGGGSSVGNTGLGVAAGAVVTTGNWNTFVGYAADAPVGFLQSATAIGARAWVAQDDSLVLGSTTGLNGATAITRVGIGTPSPQAQLDVVTDVTGRDVGQFTAHGGTSNADTSLMLRSARGTLAAPAATMGGAFGAVSFGGHDGTAFTSARASIRAFSLGAWSPSNQGADLGFFTTAFGTTTELERMTVTAGGMVGIGSVNPGDKLTVIGDVRVGTSGTNGCLRNFAGTGIIGTCSSDARFKRDISAFAPALAAVAQLRPVHYYWRASEFPDKRFGADRAYGLIAQDVEAILPELVSVDDDGYKAVDYGKLPLLAIQAIGELKRENDAMRAELAAIRAALAALTRATAAAGSVPVP